ncbi:MAG: alpha/beta hydrolase fold domain-containing protein [Gammaproteobacteria bacterium]|nr:alpha/beta hydrolase fold domain-containing protein [Gammaproteobacteria bacterium]
MISDTHTSAIKRRRFCVYSYVVLQLLLLPLSHAQQTSDTRPSIAIDSNGTVHVPAHPVPISGFLSPEGQAYLVEHLQNMQQPELLIQDGGLPPLLAPYLDRQRATYPVIKRDITIAGVHVYDYEPKAGITQTNRGRVLINLHGGGFSGCWPGCAELESIPVAAVGRIRVVSLDYRQGPEHKFPAASEDVAAVYSELLKTYAPENIGIYGCSAGGMLTGMAVAWFREHGLPKPGAVGVLCAGLTLDAFGFGGDSNYFTAAIGESRNPPPPTSAATPPLAPLGYLAEVALDDPLASPASSPDVMAWFPPTLIVTGTRGFELSSAVYTHSLLVKQGVETDLHVWEGMFHGFFYNTDVPESRDCYDVIVNFFNKHLGRS